MASYTGGGSNVTLTTGVVNNSTIADITKTGEDAYARYLLVKGDAVANDILIYSSGSACVSAGGTINGAIVNGRGRLQVSSGGVANDISTTAGTIEFWTYAGGTATNVNVNNADCYVILYGGTLTGGSVNKCAIFQVQTGAVVSNYTFLKTADAARYNLAGGTLIDCAVGAGGIYRVSGGGLVERLTVSGANARFLVSGGTLNDPLVSGGTMYLYKGTVNRATVVSGAVAGNTNRGYFYGYGGTINDITFASRGSGAFVSTTINNLYISQGVGVGTTYPTVVLYSGAVVSGGSTSATVELYVSSGAVLKDFTANPEAYIYVYSGATISGGVINGRRFSMTNGTVREAQFGMTNTNDASNRMRAGLLDSCTVIAGGIYGMQDGRAVDLTVSGANARFFVSGGELSGATVINGGRLNVSGGTVTGIVESGGYVDVKDGVNVTFAETTLTDFTFTGSATVHAATTADNATVASGGNLYVVDTTVNNTTVNSGGVLTVCASSGTVFTHGVADGVTINEGGNLNFEQGTWGWGFDNWAVASNVTVNSGGSITLKNFIHLLDVQAGEGAVLDRASNRTVIGGANTNIAKGVILDSATRSINEFGDDFEVVNGVATGLYLTGGGTTPRSAGDFDSGLTVKDATVVSGGSAYLYTGVVIDGIDVYGKGGPSGATLANLWIGGATGGGVRIGSGGYGYASDTDMDLDDIVLESGGSMDMYKGAVTDFLVSGGTLSHRGGTIDKLTVVSGADVGIGYAYLTAGATVNNLTVSAKGSTTVLGTVKDVQLLGGNGIPRFIISQGGVVEGGKTSNTVEFWFLGAGTATDVTFNTGAYVHLHAGGKVVGGSFNGARLGIKTGGIAEGLTILKSDEGTEATSHGLFDGLMSNCAIAQNGVFRISGGTATGTVIGGANARFNVYGGTVSDTTVGQGGHLSILGGTVSATKAVSGGEVLVSGGTVNDLRLSGGVYGSATVSGAVTSTLLSATTATIYSGATVSGALIEDYAVVEVSKGGTLCDPTLRMNSASEIAAKYARITVRGGLVSGGSIAGNGNTIEFYMFNAGAGTEGVASDVTFDRGTYIATYSNTVVSGGTFKAGTISMRGGNVRGTVLSGGSAEFQTTGGTIEGVTVCGSGVIKAGTNAVVRDVRVGSGGLMYVYNTAQTVSGNIVSEGGSVIVSHGANATGTIIRDGGFVQLVSGATVTDTTVSSGGYLQAAGSAKQGAVNGLTLLSGGKFLLTANSASVTGLAAEAGAVISLSFTNATAATAAAFDTLADCDATIELLNVGTATKTFNVAATGNTNQQFAMVGSGIFEGTFKAGDTYVDPFTCQQLVVAADATTIDVTSYTRTETAEAVGFATSGTFINNGKDKELMWNGATVSGAVKLIDANAATAITGDAWMDIRACSAETGAAIYGTDVNVDFNGKVRYQLHGGGDTVGNLAAGANYGGSVKGVEILTYNTTYQGVGYAGGFGDVDGEIDVIFAGGNSLNKDFYAGALYNANKVAANTTTSVGDVKMTFGEKAADSISVKGNVYGASAVKAGTVTTVENQAALHSVGDVELTLRAGTATKSDVCVFAGGYATGHDTAKAAAVYTVESVTLNVTGGSWGGTHGGRGVFGGAFAGDNIADTEHGETAYGVYAKVGNVNMTISGGTMGNIYGGGWAQKNAKSEVGDVSITIKGGTVANVFGGGSHSTSGGTTTAGNVTITVSGGTITGDIYARGQSAGDSVAAAAVTFTGSKAFSCGVYGYTYVGGEDPSAATLSYTGYTGTFSGEIGGFGGITLDGATAMTLTTAATDVSNGKWKFDLGGRDEALSGTSLLTWGAEAGFSGDTVKVNFADADQAAAGWSIADAAFTGATFTLAIGGTDVTTVAYDTEISGGDWAGWKFTDDNGTLKFKQLA